MPGFGFNEIIWDNGWIWVLILVMGLAAIFDELRHIIQAAKGPEVVKKKKPKYEIIFRQKIE